MTWSAHMSEIARQGIWASLTGGWYYEPTHSLLCNTVHLYLWLVFFLMPLLVGMLTTDPYSSYLFIYLGFVFVLFFLIKFVVLYLHRVFDSSDPIVVMKPKEPHKIMAEQRRADARRNIENARVYHRFYEMIEMNRLNRSIEIVGDEPPSVEMQPMGQNTDRERRSSAPSSQVGVSSRSVDETSFGNVSVTADVHPSRPVASNYPAYRMDRQHRPSSPRYRIRDYPHRRTQSHSSGTLERKLSEPSIPTYNDNDEDRVENEVLVTSSLCEDLHTSDTIAEVEKGLIWGGKKKRTDDDGSREEHKLKIEEIQGDDEEGKKICDRKEDNDIKHSISNPLMEDKISEGEWFKEEEGRNKERSSNEPIVEEADCSSSLHLCNIPSTSRGPMGLVAERELSQGDLTRFLEDLIDRHPSALDAIENVRVKRRREEIERPSDEENKTSGEIHVANDYEDTSQGAMHSFQDETGTWWTYTFDEQGVGTAQALGNSHQIMALLDKPSDIHPLSSSSSSQSGLSHDMDRPSTSGISSSRIIPDFDLAPGGENMTSLQQIRELQSIPEGGSSDDEVEHHHPISYRDGRRNPVPSSHLSSSSPFNRNPYMSSLPSSVLFAGGHSTRRGRSRGSFSSSSSSSTFGRSPMMYNGVPSRLVAAIRATEEMRGRVVNDDERRLQLIDHGTRPSTRSSRSSTVETTTLEQLLPSMTENERIEFANQINAAEMSVGSNILSQTEYLPRKVSNTKKKYYYNLSIIPFFKNSFKIKMDRLSIAALFDRNRSIFSVLFDILLATLLSYVAVNVLSTHIYHDVSLVVFAFVTASAHFSLVKSVQPDAASPTHGFNWQVAYSRPFYLLILSSMLLLLHFLVPQNIRDTAVPWNWNVYRLPQTSWDAIILALRDFVSTLILLLPVICTVGWMPQVSTLMHHILEQVEMHIFGGTASFGALSALAQLCRTIVCVSILVTISLLAHYIDHSTFYALPMALLVQLSFLHSRLSSNPHLWRLIIDSLDCTSSSSCSSPSSHQSSSSNRSHVLCGARVPLRDSRGEANKEGGDDDDDNDADHDTTDDKHQHSNSRNMDESTLDIGAFPPAIRATALARTKRDVFFSFILLLVTFAVYCTTVLSAAQPYITMVLIGCTFSIGWINHYLYVHLRKYTPWKLIARPILRAREYGMFEADQPASLMIFERIHMWMLICEKNILYPLTVISSLTASSRSLFYLSPILLPIMGFRLLRSAMACPHHVYIPLGLSFLVSFVDLQIYSPFNLGKEHTWLDLFPYVWYILAVFYPKWEELNLKLQFVLAYMAPWQITWGSAFHAFAQPFSVPHSILITVQTVISSIISAPLNPFLGSSFITASYVRPVKFWERDYNTERSDASNTRLASQIDRGPMLDDSNLNGVFYEHLTRSLQSSMAGDMSLGRWGASVRPGDCFILASFYLNCLVHVVEVGNGFVTFQLRGLEFRGTYCHQREVEAISEDVTEGSGCFCCSPGSLPGILSLNSAWSLRWLAWEVTSSKLIVDGYSITDNSAISLLQVHELRRLLVTLYCRCIIYFTITSKKISDWLSNETIVSTLESIEKTNRYVDVDHMFCTSNDEDYDTDQGGISRQSFLRLYSPWVDYCFRKNATLSSGDANVIWQRECKVQSLVYALTLVGRRALGAASFNRHSNAAESFLYGLHSLFKGDFRVTCSRDEWVFADMDLLQCVIAPSVRMALKLHQDHFTVSDDLEDPRSLYYLIKRHQSLLFISHEHDPDWRSAIMANTPSLLALRHMYDDGQDDYKIIMLNKMQLNMRVIKLNRECVRAFWSGQQQELVFLRNRNPERGSIQNARQVLRNMINSSADQPVGYPIYVSPLTTSFIDSHPQYEDIVGPPITLQSVSSTILSSLNRLRSHFGMTGSSSLAVTASSLSHRIKRDNVVVTSSSIPPIQSSTGGSNSSMIPPIIPPQSSSTYDRDEDPFLMEESMVEITQEGRARVVVFRNHSRPPNTMTKPKNDVTYVIVEITSENEIYRTLHEPMKCTGETLVVWPREEWRLAAVKTKVDKMTSFVGQRGMIIHTWYPNHANRALRSHIGETIHLLMLFDTCIFIPVGEKGVKVLKDTANLRLSLLREMKEEVSSPEDSADKELREVMEKGEKKDEEDHKDKDESKKIHKRTKSSSIDRKVDDEGGESSTQSSP